MNMLLLCHGTLKEIGSFELAKDQTVQYRGNFGTFLSEMAALALVQSLLSDPMMTDEQIASQIKHYKPQPPLEGPGSFAPDIQLEGDDNLLCMQMNLNTRRYIRLWSDWRSTLNREINHLDGQPAWINLLCCTKLPLDLQTAVVNPYTEVKDWSQLFLDK